MKITDTSWGAGSVIAGNFQHLLRPENLDLLAVIPATAHKKWKRKTCLGKLAHVIHVLCELRTKYRAKPDAFVPISYSILVDTLGTRYTADALRLLQDAGVIESDRRHIPGIKARGYRFAPAYRTPVEVFQGVEKTAEKSLVRQRERVSRTVGTNENYAFILECIRSLTFRADAEAFLSSPDVAEESRAPLRLSYENLKHGRFEFSSDKKTGRVFHNVTNMAKPLRKFLILNGIPCVEIDLANAQPLFLLLLYGNTAEHRKERQLFSDFVSGGCFYTRLNEIAGNPYNTATPEQEKRLKTAFLQQVLSGKNYYTGQIRDAFSETFPILSKIIADEKRLDHAALSLRLQGVESDLVVNRVITRLRLHSPPIKAITIHDALLCAVTDADTVAHVLSAEVHSLVGVVPTLRRKAHFEHAA